MLFTLNAGESLPDTRKSVSSRLIHKTGLSILNSFRQPDGIAPLIRTPEHFKTVNTYTREKPVKAYLDAGFIMRN